MDAGAGLGPPVFRHSLPAGGQSPNASLHKRAFVVSEPQQNSLAQSLQGALQLESGGWGGNVLTCVLSLGSKQDALEG